MGYCYQKKKNKNILFFKKSNIFGMVSYEHHLFKSAILPPIQLNDAEFKKNDKPGESYPQIHFSPYK